MADSFMPNRTLWLGFMWGFTGWWIFRVPWLYFIGYFWS